MKTSIIAALLLVVSAPAWAGPTDARKEKEPVLRGCLTAAGFTEVKSEEEYDKVRWVKPSHFFLGKRILISSGSAPEKFGPCLKQIDAE